MCTLDTMLCANGEGVKLIVAFCGHSTYVENIDDERKILAILEKCVADAPCDLFLGEYGGFDSFAYRCAKKFKELHHEKKLVFVTPYLSENYQKNAVEYTQGRFDQVLYPPLENVPPRYAIHRRNRWMVEQADVLIAYITHKYGGAYEMYRYATRKGKCVYNIAQDCFQ